MNHSELALFHLFDPVSLQEMDAVKLLDRVDTKFVFHRDRLIRILEEIQPFYRVLDINQCRINPYETCYFDTPDLLCYRQHHNGKLNRWKFRTRRYVITNQCFFEIKCKNNKGRMVKERIPVKKMTHTLDPASRLMVEKRTSFHPSCLQPKLVVSYDRITLVNRNFDERLTIDIGLQFHVNAMTHGFPFLVIAETKQVRESNSPFVSAMHDHHIRKRSISKYCLGIATMIQGVKINTFKPKIRYINKLANERN